ncbi:hypothetical protein G7B40_024990 [Aetokthonos hydrillicola Thurmond2011]|jgi:hypothetical protein|uniref:Uncharacterized protein n=1 Tax=Aetokthonos hydrillicola Thurmond2011 TaxID=2712845 RepID=A0AAP5IAS8_9CYAN|nr:hypothetical protein [Aetokthonos hydrillicola]MBO3458487.1 hypothetical protein [Aetokthonos hydrillicola CCALA 1050]MBW4586186.1 hypothetical protein [Aetokthonos hydrillicola CCALA 1050]MDR9897794.1 hypothetical protein [Aetokthonos hydrillicola Thurmond2011]
MTTNPLVNLGKHTANISSDISPAKAAYILSQILEKVGYDEQSFETPVDEVSSFEQDDAIRTLANMIAEVNSGKSYEESILTALSLDQERTEEIEHKTVALLLAENKEKSPSTQPLSVDELDSSPTFRRDVVEAVSTPTGQEKTLAKQHQQNTEDIHRYVIPLVLTRLMKEKSAIESEDAEGLKTRLYKSEEFTAALKVTTEGEQLLTLDRNIAMENEEARALEATRRSSQLRFDIIINNITQQELEIIKIINLQEAHKASQEVSKQGELGSHEF